MIIGVDVRVLVGERKTGVEEYTEQLLEHMTGLDPSVTFKLFFTSSKRRLREYPWMHRPNVQIHAFRISNQALFYASRFLGRPRVDRMLGGIDAFFSPHFLMTALSPDVRRVTTFHDLSFEQFPEFFSRKQWLWHKFVHPAWQARFSDRLIAVSDSTRQDLVARYHVDPARISVIPSGVAAQFRVLPHELVEGFRERKKLPKRFILSLGTFEPRKNMAALIGAFTELKRMPEFADLHLVLAGSRGWLDRATTQAIQSSPVRDAISCRYDIPDFERPWLYNAAEVFAYPSFFEGFGLPPLEAMACGTPVVGSSTSSLPEVIGDAGLLVNPYHVSDLTAALRTMMSDDELQRQFRERGLSRARGFSWRTSAESTLQAILHA